MRNNMAGFTLVELMIGLGLAGVSLLALASLSTSITNSALQSTATSENTQLRNLIQTALKQRNTVCGPRGSCCASNLRTTGGGSISVPGIPAEIKREDNVALAVQMGPGLEPFIKDGSRREQEKTDYKLVLIGKLKRRDDLKKIDDGLFLGTANFRRKNGYSFILYFALETEQF